jgi:hypothetical protein
MYVQLRGHEGLSSALSKGVCEVPAAFASSIMNSSFSIAEFSQSGEGFFAESLISGGRPGGPAKARTIDAGFRLPRVDQSSARFW